MKRKEDTLNSRYAFWCQECNSSVVDVSLTASMELLKSHIYEVFLDHVSYRGPRPIYRPIHRSILDRVSVDTRSSIGRYIGRVSTDVSTDNPIGRNTWRFTDTWPILDRYLTDTWSLLDRYLTDTWPIFHRCFTDTLHWSILDRHATGR